MRFGPYTTLTLMVDACTTLPEVRIEEVTRGVNDELKEKAKRESEKAKEEEDTTFRELQKLSLTPDIQKEVLEKQRKEFLVTANKAEKAIKKYNHLFGKDKGIGETSRPNSFVSVTLDEDTQVGRPIAFTKTYRATKRPFWHEAFKDIPIGLLAHGKWGQQLLLSGIQEYSPTRLNFWIYHDIGDDQDESKDSWKRETPKRDLLLGRACLNFGSLVCNGCETWHELPVLDIFENPISECKLRVKTQMTTALPVKHSVVVQNPLRLPGGAVCGKTDKHPCRCGNDCGGACMMGPPESFLKPCKRHNHCKAKKRKCRSKCCHHSK